MRREKEGKTEKKESDKERGKGNGRPEEIEAEQ